MVISHNVLNLDDSSASYVPARTDLMFRTPNLDSNESSMQFEREEQSSNQLLNSRPRQLHRKQNTTIMDSSKLIELRIEHESRNDSTLLPMDASTIMIEPAADHSVTMNITLDIDQTIP